MTDKYPSHSDFIHQTVLLHETVDAVLGGRQNLSGVFVDATFGRGGHSQLLLEQLADDARLIVFDKDPQAIKTAQNLASTDKRVHVIHDSFANLSTHLKQLNIALVDGILADLGVSSPQLDDGSRGFSFMNDGLVDMRMDTTRGQSVGQWLMTVDEETLANVLYEYGEERHSRKIAKAIKQMENYNSTLQLAQTIKTAHPAWQKGKHPATQSFQALRIFINNELGDIKTFLNQSLIHLKAGGHLAVISFHSLEDRLVKRFFNNHSRGRWEGDEALFIAPKRTKYFDKPKRISPTSDEIRQNPRSRSAYLRTAKRNDTSITDVCDMITDGFINPSSS